MKKVVTTSVSSTVKAVYVDDSTNYHIYQIVADDIVGSIYVKKGKKDAPQQLILDMVGGAARKELVKVLLDRTPEGSKSRTKMQKVYNSI